MLPFPLSNDRNVWHRSDIGLSMHQDVQGVLDGALDRSADVLAHLQPADFDSLSVVMAIVSYTCYGSPLGSGPG